jgi:5-methyltetrahydropteroyltriglutamate--homocysteine methyltransferase
VLLPGVISHTTNLVEHPELIAQRVARYAGVVGRERVIASADCGFAASAREVPDIDERVAWAKLASLVEGASLATKELWE